MSIRLVNLTPHPIVVFGPATPERIAAATVEPIAVIEVSDLGPARVHSSEIRADTDTTGRMPLIDTAYRLSDITGLPDPVDGIGYIVSLVVALALPHRSDLYAPTREVRNLAGTVVGCRALARPATDITTAG